MVDKGQHQPNIAFTNSATLIILVYTSEKSSITFVDKIIAKPIQWLSSIICVRRTLAYVRVEVSEVGSKSVWSNILGAINRNLKYLKSEKKLEKINFDR